MLHQLSIQSQPFRITIGYCADYYQLFLRLRERYNACYFFESLQQSKQQERYVSFGFDPLFVVLARSNTLIFQGDLTLVVSNQTFLEVPTDNPYYYLRNILPSNINCNPLEGGLIGNFGYETINYLESSINLPEHLDYPVFELGMYQDGLIWDQLTQTLEYYYYTTDRSQIVIDTLANSDQNLHAEKRPYQGLATKLTGVTSTNQPIQVQFLGNSLTQDQHRQAVLNTIEQIKMGNTFQAEVGFKTFYDIIGDKIAIYNKLREVNPSPYMFYTQFETRISFGCSPELLIACESGNIKTSPLAGTAKRGATESEDNALVKTLLDNPKEIAEHKMLVDLHRNDLSKVATIGSVIITDLMYIVKFKYVQHIATDIVAKLDVRYDSLDVLACILPGGVLTGAPKIETIKIIADNEKAPRGNYGGAVGRLSYNGDCTFVLPIRSLFCAGDNCYAQTCGGIVLDSDPDAEYQEIINKLAGMDRAIRSC